MNVLQYKINQLFQEATSLAYQQHASDLARDVSALWQLFTQDRANGLANYFQKPPLKRAYTGYYLPLYASKLALLLQQLGKEGHFVRSPKSILDLGAGPLVGSLASTLAFGKLDRIVAVDRHKGAMQIGVDLFEQSYALSQIVKPECVVEDFASSKATWKLRGQFDLIIVAHSLNELQGKQAAHQRLLVVQAALKCLTPQGRLLLVEPSHETTSKQLMVLRDQLHGQQNVHILAPCTGATECPLLKAKNTWCHSELHFKAPKECKVIDKKLGFRRETLKTSYLLLGKEKPVEGDFVRIIGGPMQAHKIERRYICDASGKQTAEAKAVNAILSLHLLTRGERVDASWFKAHHVKLETEEHKPWRNKTQAKRPKSPPTKSSVRHVKRGRSPKAETSF